MSVALPILILAIALLIVRYLCTRFYGFYLKSQVETELDQMFRWFWDGTPEDKIYAWYKVRSVLKQRHGKREQGKATRVDLKIMQLDNRLLHSDLQVDPSGNLVTKHTEFAKE
ncbi:hypothetical protein NC796_11850 [Aliifodinibius sp. S!AR15-10]|uniref:hypothetical protein n=1 Tax=Aliifodinibius sp. S!AR15-10 TaxID=2950437 RepID=UPI00285E1D13|nr:hypothetical protein [Aliifodinibius sp. S!AR15-10]MDR8391841.1 hypothetical protein [Aliifodinibius sp. S!AR15-10]